jgi:hypothetical protein
VVSNGRSATGEPRFPRRPSGFFSARPGEKSVSSDELPGHANISTTQRYMHLDDRELADAQDLVE